MNARFSPNTLVRLLTVLVIACVVTTIIAGPPQADAANGYGISANDGWHDATLIEGRAIGVSAVLSTLE